MNMNQWIAVVFAATAILLILVAIVKLIFGVPAIIYHESLTTLVAILIGASFVFFIVPRIKTLIMYPGFVGIELNLQKEGIPKIAALQKGAKVQPASGHADAKGEGGPEDTPGDDEIVQLLHDAAEHGTDPTKLFVQNPRLAARLFRDTADKGDVMGQFGLGLMYASGDGVEQNYTTARSWFQKAADKGYAPAQTSLGMMYVNGEGVKKNYTEALSWFRKAAKKEHAQAQTNLGVMYDTGKGVKKNYTTARSWFQKAADQGDAPAQTNLGVMYATGQGGDTNYTEALSWLRKAAEQGHAPAQTNLGMMYATGGGPKDDVEAYVWLSLAAEQDESVEKKKKAVGSHISRAEIAKARKLEEKYRKVCESNRQSE